DGRVRPERFGERGRCEVLGLRVQGGCDRVAAGILRRGAGPFLRTPVAGEELVGAPAEKERVRALVGLVDEGHGLAVARSHGPSAAHESAPAILIRRAAVSLHHSIDGYLRHGRQSHGLALVRWWRSIRPPRGAHLISRAWLARSTLRATASPSAAIHGRDP